MGAPQQVSLNPAQMAAASLGFIDKANVPADEQTIQLLQATRMFLRAIVSGELVVMQKPKDPADPVDATPPAGGPARGSEGVVSGPVHQRRKRL